MKIKKSLLYFALTFLMVFSLSSVTDNTYAYWASGISGNNTSTSEIITIGDWASYPTWDANTTYLVGEIVEYNGSYYEAKKDNVGYEPTVTPGWNGRWTEVIIQ